MDATPAGLRAEQRGPAWRDAPPGARPAIGLSWSLTALASAIPFIVAAELFDTVPWWIAASQIALALAVLAFSLLIRRLRVLWRFSVVMAVLLCVLAASASIDLTAAVDGLLGPGAFDARMLAAQTEKLAAALVMMAVLLLLRYRPGGFFLRVGDLTAPIRPVRLLGFPQPESWRRFGLIWGIGIAAVLGIVQFALVGPSSAEFESLWPMLVPVVVFAAMNAFSEEMTYRAPMLATLDPAVGSGHALWQSAVFFGVAHYFGTPGGLLGAAASIFMGWLLSKAMLETRGLFWAWFIHFLSDVAIFASMAVVLA